ncbi:MAG: phosphoribosylanthranilate isomerase [Desulfobaccales bacterium]
MVRIKICGITNLDDALLAAELGADALGFIFYPKSPRHVAPEAARRIIAHLPPFVAAVGVFVNEEAAFVQDLAAKVRLDWVQLHGRESPDYCRLLNLKVIKGFRIQDENSLQELEPFQGAVQALLLDTYKKGQVGGTGESFDWQLAREAKKYGRIILAGGLSPENVARAIEVAEPDAVDTASGTEAAPGRKDPAKLSAFFQAIAHEPLAHP